MNIDTGLIHMLTDGTSEREAMLQRLVPIDFAQATEKQKAEMRVSLKDHSSTLGKELTQWRSKYVPHVGAKQQAKLAARVR